jgi:hypothetical protein
MSVVESFLYLLRNGAKAATTRREETESGASCNNGSILSSKILDSAIREDEQVLASLGIFTSIHTVRSDRTSFTQNTNGDTIFKKFDLTNDSISSCKLALTSTSSSKSELV